MFKLGLIINPYAGIGGRVGLKGSDGEAIRKQALSMGAPKLAADKTAIALKELQPYAESFQVYTASGEMGEELSNHLGFKTHRLLDVKQPSTPEDTKQLVNKLIEEGVDLILFAGGDGTARDILAVCDEEQMVLGIPAGVKIHSGVYAITPLAGGQLVKSLLLGEVLSVLNVDIMDLDEAALRNGIVKAKRFGYMNVPGDLNYVQAVKNGGQESEELVLDAIADDIIERMQENDDCYYVIGSGSTCAAIMQKLALPNTLLGSDIIFQNQVYCSDAIEKDFLDLLSNGKQLRFIITVIGGQGHILGRGNHQISPEVIKRVGWNNFIIVATKTKLKQLQGRPLLVDTGSAELDKSLSGMVQVTTGYQDQVLYRLGRA
jgi:predicted polyphosphate/ATP-dependent NAD kinase